MALVSTCKWNVTMWPLWQLHRQKDALLGSDLHTYSTETMGIQPGCIHPWPWTSGLTFTYDLTIAYSMLPSANLPHHLYSHVPSSVHLTHSLPTFHSMKWTIIPLCEMDHYLRPGMQNEPIMLTEEADIIYIYATQRWCTQVCTEMGKNSFYRKVICSQHYALLLQSTCICLCITKFVPPPFWKRYFCYVIPCHSLWLVHCYGTWAFMGGLAVQARYSL